MSASAITDAFITQLGAASAFGADVSDVYKVLETTSGSCCVVSWLEVNSNLAAFGAGGTKDHNYTFAIESFVKIKTKPTEAAPKVGAAIDKVIAALWDDITVQGTVEEISAIRSSRELPPEGVLLIHGQSWHRMITEVDVIEYDDS